MEPNLYKWLSFTYPLGLTRSNIKFNIVVWFRFTVLWDCCFPFSGLGVGRGLLKN